MSNDEIKLLQNYNDYQKLLLSNSICNPLMARQNQCVTPNYNVNLSSSYSIPNFRGLTEDSVQISAENQINTQKKKMSKGAKFAIGLGSFTATLLTVMVLFSRHQTSKISKLYKEKLIPKTFKEKLEFKEATTLEEAMKYAKETLGVKEVDKEFTLEALNTTNKGVTDVINKNIGQEVFLPTKYRYTNAVINGEKEATYLAYAVKDINSSSFGELGINKNYFDDAYITKELNEIFGINTQQAAISAEKTTEAAATKVVPKNPYGLKYRADKTYHDLVAKFKANSADLSIKEKRMLYNAHITSAANAISSSIGDRLKVLEKIEQKLGKNVYDKEAFKKLSYEEQLEKLQTIFEENHCTYNIDIPLSDGVETIYHELGHLQDYAKNLKELDCAKWEFDLKKMWKDAWNEAHNGIKSKDRIGVDEISNHWGGSGYQGYSELLEKAPEKFKKKYPDLYEFLTDKEIHKTAGKVSEYAQTGIGEFIAETYAKMIKGDKISDDVMALYKKYNGPMIVGY